MMQLSHTAPRPRIMALLGALLLALATIGVAPASAAGGSERVSVIVRLVDGADPDVEAAAAARAGGDVAYVYRNVFPGFAAELPLRAVDALGRNPRVQFVEPDGVVTATSTTTQSNATWGLDRTDQRALPLDGTYRYSSTAQGIRSYIVDTGVRRTHDDFGGRVLPGATAISDGLGSDDCTGHGTHVAGTVAGSTWGVAKAAVIVPVRVLDCNGSGTTSGVIAGLDWIAREHPAGTPGVVNMSLGGGASTSLDDAVDRVSAAGLTVVVAAGNSDANACNYSPARAATAVTVGSTTSTDARSSFSNFGTCVDLFAPGSSIRSAWYTSNTATATLSGTSMAAPHVAGAALLLLAADPTLSPAQVRRALTDAATTGVVTGRGTGSPDRLLFVDATASDSGQELAAALTPSFAAPVATADGFTLQVTNHDAAYTWAVSTSSGTAAISGAGLVTVAGLAAGASATVTVTTTRTGYASGSATATGRASSDTVSGPIDPAVADLVLTQTFSGPWSRASVAVTVVDRGAPSTPLAGVTVTGEWYHNGQKLTGSSSAVTGTDGVAVLDLQIRERNADLTFLVTGLSGDGIRTKDYTEDGSAGIDQGEQLDPVGDAPDGSTPDGGDSDEGGPVGEEPGGNDPVDDAPGPIVVDVDRSGSFVSLSNGNWLSGTASILVTSNDGPRAGVLVEGVWTLDGNTTWSDHVSGTTSGSGTVSLAHANINPRTRTGTLRFCVTRLSGDGFVWNPPSDTNELCFFATRS
jgi:subtilisin family serine protease